MLVHSQSFTLERKGSLMREPGQNSMYSDLKTPQLDWKTLESLPAAVVWVDPLHRIQKMNSVAYRLFGQQLSRGSKLLEILLQHSVSEGEIESLTKYLDSNTEPQADDLFFQKNAIELTMKSRDQSVFVRVTSRPIFDSDQEEALGWIMMLTPGVSSSSGASQSSDRYARELEVANQELIEAREAALRAVRIKSDFLSNMSHEIRTPMNAVMGMAEVLADTNLDEEQRHYLKVLQNGGRTLLGIIDDILNFSRLEGGQIRLEKRPFDMRATIQKVLELVQPLADDKGLKLEFDDSGESSWFVVGDSSRLEQVLLNLVGNAVKFTASGTVRVRVLGRTRPTDDHVTIAVSDTGIGIPKDKLGELFKRFSQIDSGINKTYGGTGLGLAISKQLVELMDGTMWLESQFGQGTTFYFRVKLPPASSEQLEAAAKVPTKSRHNGDFSLTGKKILLVDDSADNSFLISTYLKKTGSHVEMARNGKEAIEAFSKQKFDLILMDMQMPEMNGYAATKWIRVLEAQRDTRVPIIALTAYALPEEVDKSFKAGCDDHLTKPIDKNRLLDTIWKHV